MVNLDQNMKHDSIFVVTSYKLPLTLLCPPETQSCGSTDPSRMYIPVILHGEVHVQAHRRFTQPIRLLQV